MAKCERTFFLFPILFSSVSLIAQMPDREILENSRAGDDGAIRRHLKSSLPDKRTAAALALANIQDTSSQKDLFRLLNDASSGVRRMAAFALGQIGDSSASEPLFRRLSVEKSPSCVKEVFNAVGKCGRPKDLRMLADAVRRFDEQYSSSIALSIARFAHRGIRDSAATAYVFGLLKSHRALPMATYAAMRAGDRGFARMNRKVLLDNLSNPDPIVRMWTASVPGLPDDSLSREALLDHALADADWRVRVNAVRALGNAKISFQALSRFLSDHDEHVSLTAFFILKAAPEKYFDSLLLSILNDTVRYSWRQRGEAGIILAKVRKEESVSLLLPLTSDKAPLKAKVIAALGETGSLLVLPTIRELLDGSNSSEVTNAIEAYQRIVEGKDSVVQRQFCDDIIPLLGRKDVAISYTVAVALRDTLIRETIKKEYIPQYCEAFRVFSTPVDVEPKVEFIRLFSELKDERTIPVLLEGLEDKDRTVALASAEALYELTGKKYDSRVRRHTLLGRQGYTENEWKLLHDIRYVILHTSKGDIRIEFKTFAAPYTILNFILLSRKHFYDGLTFHRVVPNFVAQGGDPLGSGFGGPGYAIGTEVHPDALYGTGAVGMASAGKDTEGSQFFITHCPTPHLDGRYTIFAFTKDMDVVNRIQVGDVISWVELKRN